jgi:acyl CoA:acetate/3-ketoacid CoA transferase
MDMKAMEARKVAIEEGKLRVLEEELQTKKVKQECEIMFMDIRGLDETQKAYVLTMRAQILESKMGGSGSRNGSV